MTLPRALLTFAIVATLATGGALLAPATSIARADDGADLVKNGKARLERDEYRGAIECFTRALELDPDQPRIWCLRGHTRMALGDLAGARADLDRALMLDPTDAGAYRTRAAISMKMERIDEAKRDLDRARELDPGEPGDGHDHGEDEGERWREIKVHVGPDGTVEVNGRKVAATALAATLKELSDGRDETAIIVDAHPGIAFGRLQEVFDACSEAGLFRVSLAPPRDGDETDPGAGAPEPAGPLARSLRVRIRRQSPDGLEWTLQNIDTYPDARSLARALGVLAARERDEDGAPLTVTIDADDDVPSAAIIEILNALVAERIENVQFAAAPPGGAEEAPVGPDAERRYLAEIEDLRRRLRAAEDQLLIQARQLEVERRRLHDQIAELERRLAGRGGVAGRPGGLPGGTPGGVPLTPGGAAGDDDPDDAFERIEKELAADPRNGGAWVERARLRMRKGDLDGAMADVSRAIELDPSNVGAWRARGAIRRAMGDFAGAMADLDRAIALDPKSARSMIARAKVRASLGDVAGALEDATRALKLAPNDGDGWSTRGTIQARAGRLEEALADYQQALRLDPTDGDVTLNLAQVLVQLGRLAEAVAMIDRAIEIDPTQWRAYYIRGVTRANMGDLEAAKADLERALELQPGASEVRDMLEKIAGEGGGKRR